MQIFINYLFIWFLFFGFSVEAKLDKSNFFHFEKQSEVGWQVDSLIQQSNFYIKDDLQNSLAFALNALEVSFQTNNKYDLLNAYSQLGKVYYYIGINDKCYVNWQKAREIAIELSDEEKISNVTFNLVALLISIKEYDKAQNYLNQVKPYYFSNNAPEFLLRQLSVINNQAIIYQNKGLIDEAQKSFEEGMTIFNQLENKTSNLSLLNAYTFFLIQQKNFSLAIETLDIINQLNGESDNYNAQIDATTQFRYAIIYNALNNKDKLNYHLNKGIETAKSINSISLLKEFNYLYYTINKAEENKGKALLYKERYDSLFQLEKVNESKLAILRDELEEKNINFKTQLESEALKSKRQKTIIYSTFLCILILLFILILRAKKQQTEKHFAKKNLNNLKNKVATTQKEIVTLELKQIEQSAMFKKIISDLQSNSLLKKTHVDDKKQLKLLNNQTKALWKEFELRFNQIDHGFYEKLDATCQELSNKERRLCALIRLDFTSKEIATINNQTLRSVEIARTRIRKKVNLTNTKTKLDVFLKQL